jgi:hypothetical protein
MGNYQEHEESTRNFGKAINWFEDNWEWKADGHYKGYINPEHRSQSISIATIRRIVINRVPMLLMWPEDLKEIK